VLNDGKQRLAKSVLANGGHSISVNQPDDAVDDGERMKEDIRLNMWHEIGVRTQQLGVPELTYFRHLS